ncbi:unnamed protein product [Protopolystoma xenopodis]|uniref:Uncharacterized protein n=1 Tax=Protopolystoma xenopodis TaxID=117903 RepID=A0A448XEH6_9PLAT|nr:unnamed protein product [Protopolystoma xenopodis]
MRRLKNQRIRCRRVHSICHPPRHPSLGLSGRPAIHTGFLYSVKKEPTFSKIWDTSSGVDFLFLTCLAPLRRIPHYALLQLQFFYFHILALKIVLVLRINFLSTYFRPTSSACFWSGRFRLPTAAGFAYVNRAFFSIYLSFHLAIDHSRIFRLIGHCERPPRRCSWQTRKHKRNNIHANSYPVQLAGFPKSTGTRVHASKADKQGCAHT